MTTTRTTERTSLGWTYDDAALVIMVARLTPGDLPSAPWVLKRTTPALIGKSFSLGGPFVTVTNNEVWLRALQLDVLRGPHGPRAKTGGLQADLRALAVVLAI